MPSDPAFLWLLPEHAVDRFAAALGGTRLLTSGERAALGRRLTPGAARRYLGARLLCRYALSARVPRPLEHWRFTTGEHGRPEPLPDGEGLRFNLSHTEGLIACVVTRGRGCGVDVGPDPAPAGLVTWLEPRLAPAERAELAASAPGVRNAVAGELWVLKEAYLKALGTGLTRDLGGFAFGPRGSGRIRVHDRDRRRPPDAAARWWFDLLRPAPGYLVAVAAEDGHPEDLRRIDLAPLSPLDLPHAGPSPLDLSHADLSSV
ncbi:4'-phosphopantetheinyl transferase superfamily protein [Streptomyces sp. PTY087I2]|uniref:4'-phosphopantetheinyl transferase family protein n=1 Tax=Streptomyces sp. PTY087I2 TaxID=1819298 RepID=UPI00080BD04A|nr:4'-phosphopantetheinyl transferase superfamily protein [Streptomyces sp. PTY087I2]OCC10623.1 4'-phosphopantetheinyl transferase sfp [Streptomyces sp. PTY087I2]